MERETRPLQRGRTVRVLAGVGVGGVALGAAGILYSARRVDHAVPLEPAVDAPRRTLNLADVGTVSYYVDDEAQGRPIVLVHSINAGASAYEMRPLFEAYRKVRPVYALELPGFGFAERADRVYSPRLYTDAILGFLRSLDLPAGGADVVALSLSCEFVARAAVEQPDLIASLVLLSPSGLSSKSAKNRSERRSEGTGAQRLYRVFATPLWAQAFYDALASRSSIRWFLSRSFVSEPDAGLVRYGYATTHQPGARYAPLYFVSGQLFTPAIRQAVYERVTQPVLVLYDEDAYVRFDALPALVAARPNWHAVRVAPSRGLPQFDRLNETIQAMGAFWHSPAAVSRHARS